MQLKAACALLLSQAVTVSTPVCKALLKGGVASLVSLASGVVPGASPLMRMQAADLLKFCLARVRLATEKPADQALLDSLPKLVGELRAAMTPLMDTIQRYITEEEGAVKGAGVTIKDVDTAASLIRSICGALWGLVAALRVSYGKSGTDEMDASMRVPASPGLLRILRKLMELAPERTKFANERAERLSKVFGKSVRSFVLGLLSGLGYFSIHPPTEESEAMFAEEQEAYESVSRALGTYEEETRSQPSSPNRMGLPPAKRDKKEEAICTIQACQRGKIGRRSVTARKGSIKAGRGRLRRGAILSSTRRAGAAASAVSSRVWAPIGSSTRARSTGRSRVRTSAYSDALCRSFSSISSGRCSTATSRRRGSPNVMRRRSARPRRWPLPHSSMLTSSIECSRYVRSFKGRRESRGASRALRCVSTATSLARSSPLRRITTRRYRRARLAIGGVRLSKSQLERVIQQMPLSQSATKLGAVILWLQACIGSSDLIEELGGALVLCKMLTSAVIENSLQGTYLQQATWVCAALWRLSFHPENAATCLEHATPALLVAMQQTEYAPLSAAALGCVNVVLSGQIEQIGAKFEEYGFADALHMLSGNGGFRESDRITAARTLNNVDEQQREGADEVEEGRRPRRRQRRRRPHWSNRSTLVRLSPLPMISRRRSTA